MFVKHKLHKYEENKTFVCKCEQNVFISTSFVCLFLATFMQLLDFFLTQNEVINSIFLVLYDLAQHHNAN